MVDRLSLPPSPRGPQTSNTLCVPGTMTPSISTCSLVSDHSVSPTDSPLFTYCQTTKPTNRKYKRRRSSARSPPHSVSNIFHYLENFKELVGVAWAVKRKSKPTHLTLWREWYNLIKKTFNYYRWTTSIVTLWTKTSITSFDTKRHQHSRV